MADSHSTIWITCHVCQETFSPKTDIAVAQELCATCLEFLQATRNFIKGKQSPRGSINMLISVIMNPNYDRSRARRTGTKINIRGLKYVDYLKTEHWKAVRFRAMARADWKCALCFSPKGIEVHHKHYSSLGRELPKDLIVLCRVCHFRARQEKAKKKVEGESWT